MVRKKRKGCGEGERGEGTENSTKRGTNEENNDISISSNIPVFGWYGTIPRSNTLLPQNN